MAEVRRRRFLIAAGALLAAPAAVHAQQAAGMRRVGFVVPSQLRISSFDAFRQGLREAGHIEGKNIILEVRSAEGKSERLPQLIAELLSLKVEVIVAASTPGALAVKKATTTVPVVFGGVLDPVGSGIVASLARPGGNITGVTFGIGGAGFGGKWVELLKEAAPDVSHVAAVWNSVNPDASVVRDMQAGARTVNVRLDVLDAGNLTQLDRAFAAIGTSGARALIVTADPFSFPNCAKLVQFGASKRMPAVYVSKDFVDVGGLMSYGSSLAESYRRAAAHVDKILKGAKPADLPIEQPTKFELVINVKAARALGLTIPQMLVARADQVIE